MTDSSLIDSLTAAVPARPEDVPLRLHLVRLLLDAGRQDEAISHAVAGIAVRAGQHRGAGTDGAGDRGARTRTARFGTGACGCRHGLGRLRGTALRRDPAPLRPGR